MISDINGGLILFNANKPNIRPRQANMDTKNLVIFAAIAAVLVGATGIATADNAFAGKKREYSQATSQHRYR